jgi:DNA-binding transcriptional MocR family regulator
MTRARRGGRKPDRTGRSKGDPQFLLLPYSTVRHDTWRSLGGPAAKVWMELRSRFNGYNNGKIFLSLSDAATLLHLSKSTAKRAFEELQEKGFVRLRMKGDWYGRRASEWILTDVPYGDKSATRDWENWRQPEGAEKRNAVPRRRRYKRNSAARVPTNGSWDRMETREEDSPTDHDAD